MATVSGVDVPATAADNDQVIPADLMGALLARYAIVQIFTRCTDGHWSIRHLAGARALSPNDSVADEEHLEGLVHWAVSVDRERISNALVSVSEGLICWHGQCQIEDIDGQQLWVDIEAFQVVIRGGRTLYCLLGSDTSQSMHTAKTLSDLREHWALASAAAGLGTLSYDVAQGHLHLDRSAANQHGLDADHAGTLALDEWVGLMVKEDRLKAHALLTSTPHPETTDSLNVRVQCGDGRTLRILSLAFRSTADCTRLIGSCRDITKELSLEEMRRQKLAAERANKSKREFMSQVSHELRTPLNGILGFAQAMMMDAENPLPQPQQQRLDVLLYSARRLQTLIDQLLDIAKIEQGKLALRLRSVNVRAVAERCIAQVQHLAGDQAVSIELDIESSDKSSVRADAGALEQILINLLSNAIKYNRSSGRVRIRFGEETDGVIVVEDTGRGITDSEMGRLFEPFNRLSASQSRVQGHGLGLVITKRLVEAMRGRLQVESKPGRGSRFSVYLPLAGQARSSVLPTRQMELSLRNDSTKHYHVLYVEDDEVNTLLMEQVFLTKTGWTLSTTPDGTEGVKQAIRQRPDVILLDMNLPDMSGLEVFKRIRSDPRTRRIPCIAVSADAMPTQIRRAMAEGFDDYWVKPLELGSVVGKLMGLLD